MELTGFLCRQPFQHVIQVGVWLMAVQLGGLDQAHDVGGALGISRS